MRTVMQYLLNPCGDRSCWFCKGLRYYYLAQGVVLLLLLGVWLWEHLR